MSQTDEFDCSHLLHFVFCPSLPPFPLCGKCDLSKYDATLTCSLITLAIPGLCFPVML
jgi:hypothetical protein